MCPCHDPGVFGHTRCDAARPDPLADVMKDAEKNDAADRLAKIRHQERRKILGGNRDTASRWRR